MYPVRRTTLVLLVLAVAASGCGGSITDVAPRTAGAAPTQAASPFCDAVEQSREAAEPVARRGAGQRVDNVQDVADQVRSANQQTVALAPPELRADVERVVAVVDRQLRLLEDSGGDTLVLARDPELDRAASDPGYVAASRRLSDYVRTTC